MLHNVFFLTILFYLFISLASSTPTQCPPKTNGFTASLIPPLSPRSPFYSQILSANNIPTTYTNVTLDRTHFQKWLITKRQSKSLNDYSDVAFNKDASYHVMDLYIGDPVQLVYAIFDTGSDITWFQCEGRAGIGKFTYYNQSKSNTYKVVDCNDQVRCQTKRGDMSCGRDPSDTSCNFFLGYLGSGEYAKGVISSDATTLKPSWEVLQDFVFGCSSDNGLDLPGIIGASNSFYSMPSQIYPDDPKFSYCIPNDYTKTSFVKFGIDANLTGQPIKLLRHRLQKYYYMDVIGVQVNGEDINVSPSVFTMSTDGRTGFVIDSGSTTTSLSSVAFDALKDKVSNFLGTATGYRDNYFEICYPSSTFGSIWPYKSRPKLGIKSRDSSVFEFDESKAWHKMLNSDLECLQVYRQTKDNVSILGSEQLLDVNVGHDPNNNLLYLGLTVCPTA